MKKTFYFPHDFNARTDVRIQKVMLRLGHAGKSAYWDLIEMLHEAGGELPLDYEVYGFITHTSAEIIKQLINDFELFETNNDFFWSKRVKENLKTQEEKNTQKKEAGRKGGLVSRKTSEEEKKISGAYEKDKQRLSGAYEKISKRKEKKRKEIIKLPKGNSNETEFFEKISENENTQKTEYGNPRVNRMLEFLKNRIGIEDFRENQKMQRNYAYLLVGIEDDKGEDEFRMQVNAILNDEFRTKNANSIGFIYREMKSLRQGTAETSDLTAEELKAKIENALDFPKNDEQNQKRMEEQTQRAAEELKKIGIIP